MNCFILTLMSKDPSAAPRPAWRVMISSTFTDFKDHRKALIDAIHKQDFKAEVMENSAAKAMDVIESSLNMVRYSAAVVMLIGMKYGQIPVCDQRNPKNLSITELELIEAMRLERPILLFLMADDHLITRADIERNPDKEKKLTEFRERAKQIGPNPGLHRIYVEFHSLVEFEKEAIHSIANLHRELDQAKHSEEPPPTGPAPRDPIPHPPNLYAEPPYIGSHKFVGRKAQLDTLNDWAVAS